MRPPPMPAAARDQRLGASGRRRRSRPTMRPSRMTMTRSDMPRISGSSEETMMTASPCAASSRHEVMDRGLGADVDALGRLVEDDDPRAWSPAIWRSPPSAGCRPTACPRPGRGWRRAGRAARRSRAPASNSCGEPQEARCATVRLERGQRDVLEDRQAADDALPAALLRHIDDAARDRVRRRADDGDARRRDGSAPFDGLVMPNSACITSERPAPTSP